VHETAIDWDRWRAEFPSCQHVVHMNHAGLAPLPLRVARAVEAFVAGGVAFAEGTSERWKQRSEQVRAALARLLHARSEEIAFVQNTAEGLSLVAAGLPWREGDNVVALADEYPSNVYPWFGLRRWGVETRLVARVEQRLRLDDVAAAINGRTRVLAVSAVDWQSGYRFQLASLAELCRRRRVLLCVDGIQAVGALDVDVETLGIDFLAAGAHKWLLAPEGCGVLFISRRLVERIEPVVLGWKSVSRSDVYLPYHFELRPDAARVEPGSPPYLAIHALGAAVDLLLEVGAPAIEGRVLALTAKLGEELRRRGAELLSPWETQERSAIVTFRLGDCAALQAAFRNKGIITRPRMGGIRLAPHFYNNDDDVARVLTVVDAHRHR
jgi:cysteine desulfurase/selenocysteine lyase